MANSSRRRMDDKGRTFMPMNVEGGQYDEHFINTTKTATIILMALGVFVIGGYLKKGNFTSQGTAIIIFMVAMVYMLIIRYVIFEERYYYRMYKKMQLYKNPKPDVFWNIASIRDEDEGALLNYGDGKIGVIVKLNRDTIVGKDTEFREIHYDALSDFYKDLNLKDYRFVQCNLMEQAGKDPRLGILDNVVHKSDNKNIRTILEQELGHIKRITRATLFESDYFLIYTRDINRVDTIMDDVVDAVYTVLDGAFVDYTILTKTEVIELQRELSNVGYFDYSEASMNTFKSNGVGLGKAFDIVSVRFDNGIEREVGNTEISRLKYLASCIEKGSVAYGDWSINDAMDGIIDKEKDKKLVEKQRRVQWGVDSSKLLDNEDNESRFDIINEEIADFNDINDEDNSLDSNSANEQQDDEIIDF